MGIVSYYKYKNCNLEYCTESLNLLPLSIGSLDVDCPFQDYTIIFNFFTVPYLVRIGPLVCYHLKLVIKALGRPRQFTLFYLSQEVCNFNTIFFI